MMLISIEIMLNAANISLAAFSHYLQDMRGQVFVFFVIAVAAAEVAIGLAIVIAIFRNKPTVNVDEINILKW
jgi:NADH-quinone oxidoreductase subunit K